MAENNWGIKLDAVDTDRVSMSTNFDIKNLSQFTHEMWVKPGSGATSSNQRAFSIRQGGSKRSLRFACVPIAGKLRYELARVDGTQDTNYTYPYDWDDYWHHVAFTADIDTKEYNIYIDGGLVQTGRIVDGGTGLAISNTTASAVTAGAWSPTTTEADFIYWDGKIDNIRLWSDIRTASEIADNMYDHVLTSEAGLIEEWRFNEGSGFTSNGSKNVAWAATHYRANGTVQTALHWNTDRPFLGDLVNDVDPPTDPTMTAPTSITSDGFTLNWTGSTDDVYVQYYEITVATDSAFTSAVTSYSALNVGLVLTYDIEDLTPSTNYYARVRAFDAAGNASAYVTYNSNAVITTLAGADVTAPDAPVATSATSVSDSGFTANWNAATDNIAVTGYKLDVATDEEFTTFVAGFQNLDVGNVLTYAVSSAIDPSTSYYYRTRAYDAAQNESVESNVVTVTTSAPPDTEDPSVVVTQTATSIGSTSFTARWNVGVDNVGVTGYLLDLATDENFSVFVSGYQNLDVGNVTSYGIAFLTPQTGYYYRVRAYDAAGNISADTDAPELVTTRASTVDEGGTIEITHFPTEDTYIAETASTTNYGTATSLYVDGSPDTKYAYLYFDLNEITGTIVNANLRLYVTDVSAGSISIQLLSADVDADTVTWANDTTSFTGTAVVFTPSVLNAYNEVDIASLLSGPGGYWVAIHTTSTDQLVFNSVDATTNQPQLVVETDPTSSTEIDDVSASASNVTRTNLIKNPSAEVGGTAFGGATGITAIGAATLLQDSTYSYDDTYSCKVVTTAATGDGVKFESSTALAIAGTGQTFKGAVHLKSNSYLTVSAKIRLTYTDASTTDGASVTVPGFFYWRKKDLPAVTATSGKTVDKVEVLITDPSTSLLTFWVDSVIAIETDDDVFYFDGGSHATDADWNGTADASSSTFEGAQLDATTTYLGDGDEDNSVVVRYKRAEDADWIEPYGLSPSTNRSTKTVTAAIGPIMVGNLLSNPAFDAIMPASGNYPEDWGIVATGTTLLVVEAAERPDGSEGNILSVVTNNFAKGAHSDAVVYHPSVGDVLTVSVYMKGYVGGEALNLQIVEYSTAGAILTTHTTAISLTTDWVRYSYTTTLSNASVSSVAVRMVAASAAASWYMAWVQLEPGDVLNPYIDGTMGDGIWSGTEYRSSSYRIISHEVEYQVETEFTDPDGVSGANPRSASVTTSATPDDPLTTGTITLTANNNDIAVVATYTGDDNATATARLQWKRSDLSTWSTGAFSWDRDNKQITATVANLKPGTDYDIKVTFTDTDDGVYGVNPLTDTVTTGTTGLTPEAKEKISFGGFMLSGDDDSAFWVTEHDAFSHPDRVTQVEQLPRSDGAVELSDWWGKRRIKVRGVVIGDTRSDLYDRIAELRKALAPRQQRLVIDTLAANNYYFNATCTSLGITEVAGETFRHVVYDAEFTCADPFRYEASETTESDIELFDDEEVVITNDGDIHIDPTFTITTTSSTGVSLTLVNETTGERITPDGTISSGDRLIIDSSALSVTKNGVEIDYAGGFPRLTTGQNTISVVLSANSINMTVRRRHRYL